MDAGYIGEMLLLSVFAKLRKERKRTVPAPVEAFFELKHVVESSVVFGTEDVGDSMVSQNV